LAQGKLSYDEIQEVFKQYVEQNNIVIEASTFIDIASLKDFNETLYDDLCANADYVYDAMLHTYTNITEIRFYNHPKRKDVRQISCDDFGKLVSFECVIKTVPQLESVGDTVMYSCGFCGEYISMPQDTPDTARAPTRCPNPSCGRAGSFNLVKYFSTFKKFQIIKVQELPEKLKGGEMPSSLKVEVYNDLTKTFNGGNRVVITGWVKPKQIRANNTKTNRYTHIVHACNIEVLDSKNNEIQLSEKDIDDITTLAKTDKLLDKFAQSIAPTIKGNEIIKQAIVLQLFGSDAIEFDTTRIRGDIHILLIGDPAVGKSDLIKASTIVAPRAMYTVGRGSTGVGLTAVAVKDDEGRFNLEAGALIVCNDGMVGVDELDKMHPEDRTMLHEAMEQQTITINKAGIQASMPAVTSLLAGANPKESRFDIYKGLKEQIDLPDTILSRFDLIYIILDTPEEEKDKALVRHIFNLYQAENKIAPKVEVDLFRKYIYYAREHFNPILDNTCTEYVEVIASFYANKRQAGKDLYGVNTARQIHGIMRLARAHARMRLSNKVMLEDFKAVLDIFENNIMESVTGMCMKAQQQETEVSMCENS